MRVHELHQWSATATTTTRAKLLELSNKRIAGHAQSHLKMSRDCHVFCFLSNPNLHLTHSHQLLCVAVALCVGSSWTQVSRVRIKRLTVPLVHYNPKFSLVLPPRIPKPICWVKIFTPMHHISFWMWTCLAIPLQTNRVNQLLHTKGSSPFIHDMVWNMFVILK